MNCSYTTILSSESFVPGVEALYKQIRKYSSVQFTVFISNDISDKTKDKLEKLGMGVIREEKPFFDSGIIGEKQAKDRWNKTLFKFVIFKNHGFDKLVYLDSDLLIRDNIDELFDKPEWSAVPDKLFYTEYSRGGLNAGVMVIKPSLETYNNLVDLVKCVSQKQEIFGDQDVINEYIPDWEYRNDLHLGGEYNTCFYTKKGNKNPKVVHFIFESKPWMWSRKQIALKKLKWLMTLQVRKIKHLNEYLRG